VKEVSIKKREKSNSFSKTKIDPEEIEEMVMNFHSVDTNVTVKAYCPIVFHYIRKADGVKDNDIIKSLDPTNNRYQIFKSNQG